MIKWYLKPKNDNELEYDTSNNAPILMTVRLGKLTVYKLEKGEYIIVDENSKLYQLADKFWNTPWNTRDD